MITPITVNNNISYQGSKHTLERNELSKIRKSKYQKRQENEEKSHPHSKQILTAYGLLAAAIISYGTAETIQERNKANINPKTSISQVQETGEEGAENAPIKENKGKNKKPKVHKEETTTKAEETTEAQKTTKETTTKETTTKAEETTEAQKTTKETTTKETTTKKETTTQAPATTEAQTIKEEPVYNSYVKLDSEIKEALDKRLGYGFSAKVEQVAANINCHPADLLGMMYSESGLNPRAYEPNYGASGLIQIMPATAPTIGTTTAAIRNMSAVEQLDYVEAYFKLNKKTFLGSENARLDGGTMYTLCFLPAYAKNEILAVRGGRYYGPNSGLDLNKDGMITKSDLNRRISNKYNEMYKNFI